MTAQPLAHAPPAPLAARYAQVRAQTLALAAPLTEADCQVQSMPDASPAKWHLAHVTWFFETFVLERFERHFKPHHTAFRVLFNSYYNGVGDQHPRPQRGLITRPNLAEVRAYRAAVDERVLALMAHDSIGRTGRVDRTGPAARTAAPGAAADRCAAPAVVQPAGPGLPRALAAGARGASAVGLAAPGRRPGGSGAWR
jgi:hypothetical protein